MTTVSNAWHSLRRSFRRSFRSAVVHANFRGIRAPHDEQETALVHDHFLRLLDRLGIQLEYRALQQQGWEAMRKRLARDRGLLIANHPGGGDVIPIMLLMMHRDYKFMIGRVDEFGFLLGPERAVPAPRDVATLRRLLVSIATHIANGGLFALFPTAGEERNGKGFEFQSGFRYLLQRMSPDDLVHVVCVDPRDAERIHLRRRGIGAALEAVATRWCNPNHLVRRRLRIDERSTTAREWQDVMRGLPPARANAALTSYYLQLMGRTRQEMATRPRGARPG